MKKNLLLMLSSSPLLFFPSITISCNTLVSSPNEDDLKPENISLSFDDYFANYNSSVWDSRNELKTKITNIINKYRLKEWNEYYETLNISNVLNINLSDYDKQVIGWKDVNWTEFGSDSNIASQNYLNQDEQFRYMNDFINLINEEDSKNHEDFLYLRWKYYSIFGAELYQKEVSFPFKDAPSNNEEQQMKKLIIKDAKISDWIERISKCVIEANADDLLELIYTFFLYYGIIPDGSKLEDYFTHLKEELKKPGQAINNLKSEMERLINEFGEDFVDKLMDFYDKTKNEYEKLNGKQLSFSEFLKDMKKISEDFKDLQQEYKDVVDKWINFNLKDEVINVIENLWESTIPNIQEPDFIYDLNFGLQNSVLHTKLCSQDMLMRLLSKNYPKDSRYLLWQAKKKRALDIYKLTTFYNNLLIRSFLPPKDGIVKLIVDSLLKEINHFFPIKNNAINKIMNKYLSKLIEGVLKEIVNKIFNQIETILDSTIKKTYGELRLVYIELNKYYN